MSLGTIFTELKSFADPVRAANYSRFFKTGPGEYGEGDRFWGIKVPQQRKVALRNLDLSLSELRELIKSPVHEHRFTALEILVAQFEKGDPAQRERIAKFYLKHTRYINNWDLVDTSASYVLGAYLFDRDRSVLYRLAGSDSLWERRIAVISTQYFIRHDDFKDTLKISELLLADQHDLIHKAVGWMLREVGNRSLETEENFLRMFAPKMPRTMLRYAIEKFPASKKKIYLETGRSTKKS